MVVYAFCSLPLPLVNHDQYQYAAEEFKFLSPVFGEGAAIVVAERRRASAMLSVSRTLSVAGVWISCLLSFLLCECFITFGDPSTSPPVLVPCV